MRLAAAFLFACLGFWQQPVQAQVPNRVHILLGSYHAVPARQSFDYDETNPGLIFTWNDQWRGLDASAGLFQNSFGDISALIGLTRTWEWHADAKITAVAAIANYDEDDPIFQPLGGGLVLIPSLQLTWRSTFIQATPLPDPDNLGLIFAYGLAFDL